MTVIRPPEFATSRMPNEPRAGLIAPDVVLEGQLEEGGLEQVLVIGITDTGALRAASSHPHVADNILLLERVKRHLMDQFEGDQFG